MDTFTFILPEGNEAHEPKPKTPQQRNHANLLKTCRYFLDNAVKHSVPTKVMHEPAKVRYIVTDHMYDAIKELVEEMGR